MKPVNGEGGTAHDLFISGNEWLPTFIERERERGRDRARAVANYSAKMKVETRDVTTTYAVDDVEERDLLPAANGASL